MSTEVELLGIVIAEPMTMLTDYMITAACCWFAAKLVLAGEHRRKGCRRSWGLGFLFVGIGALLGGTSHGFAPYLTDTAMRWIWTGTLACVGLSMFLAVAGTIRGTELQSGWRASLRFVNVAGLIAYMAWIATHDTFMAVIVDSVLALLLVALIQAWAWHESQAESAKWLISGVLVSFLSAAVQQSGISVHVHFNHNDLYHIVQLLGVYLLYRGVCLLADWQDRPPVKKYSRDELLKQSRNIIGG
jgi:hypothetical protein